MADTVVDETPTQRAARLRREKREKKFTEGGADRLAKITGASGRVEDFQPASPPKPSLADSSDPPEVDISRAPPATFTSPSSSSIPATASQQDPFLAMMHQAQQQHQMNTKTDANGGDPMMQMIQQLFSPPPGTQTPIPGAAGTAGGPPDGLPPGLASMLNGNGADAAPQATQPPPKSSYVWRILHTVFSLLLAGYIAMVLPFDGSREERESPMAQPQSIFWMFATVELGLQSARYILEKGSPQSGGMLGTVANILPKPYGNWVLLAARYAGYWQTLSEDALMVVFVLGVLGLWKGTIVA